MSTFVPKEKRNKHVLVWGLKNFTWESKKSGRDPDTRLQLVLEVSIVKGKSTNNDFNDINSNTDLLKTKGLHVLEHYHPTLIISIPFLK